MSDNGEQEKKENRVPGLPPNYEGCPEYEEKLLQPCFYTGRPCPKKECPRCLCCL